MPEKEEIAALFREIAVMLEIKGDNPFKIRAYQTAAGIVENMDGDLRQLSASGELAKHKGIGKAVEGKIAEFLEAGKITYYEELKSSIPPVLFELIKIPGLGPKKALILAGELGIQSIGELEYACRENRLSGLAGFGEKTQQKILQGIEYVKKYQGQFLLVDAWPVAQKIAEYLSAHEFVAEAAVAGSIRRRKEIVKDIDIVVAASQGSKVNEAVVSMPGVTAVIGSGPTKTSVTLATGMNLDVRVVGPELFAAALHHFTGSRDHHISLRGIAKEKGYKINEYGIEQADGKLLAVESEQQIYQLLGLPYIVPELREGMDEIDAALTGKLPVLIREQDIQGSFHMHTTYSDGSNSLAEMAAAAQSRGWSYIGITDHSQTAVYAKGLKLERVQAQRREIEALNAQNKDFRIFAGIESDILPDGSLDYPDEILAEFDFVIASVHSAFRQSKADMTRRIISALQNPYVTMLGHPTGRILLARDGYALDLAEVLAAAAATGTIVEINSSPYRLDLDWRWHRQAKQAGIAFSINPDAHSVEELDQVLFGVAMARKGWLTADDVVNTRDKDAVIAFLQAKRIKN